MTVKCIAPVEKFRDYIFKPGATHGKDSIFRSLGYNQQHSQRLVEIYEQQAAAKYSSGDFTLGLRDEYGQRVDIEIEIVVIILTESSEHIAETSFLRSGWMVQAEGGLRLNTPFSGFTRNRVRRQL